MKTKKQLRCELKYLMNLLLPREVEEFSSQIIASLLTLDEIVNSSTFFVYASVNKEVRTYNLMQELLARGKQVTVPKILGKGIMQPCQILNLNELRIEKYGFPEPIIYLPYNRTHDVCIVPGVAFTKKGERLGSGAGYYDRYLAKNEQKLVIALAYELQIVPFIPQEAHDMPVDIIVTENRVIKTHS